MLSGGKPVKDTIDFYDDDGSNFGLGSGAGFVAAPAAYGLIEKLAERTYIGLQAGDSYWNVTLHGFNDASAAVVRTCPEPQVTEAPVTAAHDYPDVWESFEPGFTIARYDEGRNWLGSFVCEPTSTYLSLQGELVESVIARNPDPSGERMAVNVPVTLTGDAGKLFDDRVFCDWGANEGDTDSCFVVLDTDRLDSLYGTGFLAITLDGESLDPVAFGTSDTIQQGRQTCYRNTAS